jgi:hypothetical protein
MSPICRSCTWSTHFHRCSRSSPTLHVSNTPQLSHGATHIRVAVVVRAIRVGVVVGVVIGGARAIVASTVVVALYNELNINEPKV